MNLQIGTKKKKTECHQEDSLVCKMSSRTARAVIQRNHASKINKRRKEGKKERKKERKKEKKEKKRKQRQFLFFFLFLCQVIYFNFSFSFKIAFAATVFRKKCWTM